jgi:glucose/mannose transport system substrate-binding protein
VLHWWTSASERQAINVVVNQLAKQDIQWRDVAIPGGAGIGAAKGIEEHGAGQPRPGSHAVEWRGLRRVGRPRPLAGAGQCGRAGQLGKADVPHRLVAAQQPRPRGGRALGIHRINSLFYNTAIFKRYNLTPPKTWDDFDQIVKKLQGTGIVPLAQSAEAWQLATLFENLALAESGPPIIAACSWR